MGGCGVRRVLTTTNESHPRTPAPVDASQFADCDILVWQIYIDGTPFLGVPFTRGSASEIEHAASEAKRHQEQIMATGRYEYVDLRLRPDRRSGAEERRQDDEWRREAGRRQTDWRIA